MKLGLAPLWCLLLGSGGMKDTVSVGAHAPGQPASLKGAGWEGARQLGFLYCGASGQVLPQPRDSSGAAAAQGEETQSRSHALLDTLLVVREGTVPSHVRVELAVVLAWAGRTARCRRQAKPQREAFH